jgi:hypothetical protein
MFGRLKRTWLIVSLPIWILILVQCEPTALTSPIITPPASTLTEVALRQTLVAKATVLVQIDQTEMAAALTPHPKVLKPTPVGLPTIALPPTAFPPLAGSNFVGNPGVSAGAGFIAHGLRPYYVADGFNSENMWIEDNDTRTLRTFVSLGYLSGPGGEITLQGAVDVRVLNPAYALVYQKRVLTPTQAGPIHVVDAVGERLILQSTNGTIFYFDVPTRQFVSSLDVVVPTFTPSPMSPLPTPISPIATP